ncbi:MAG: DNA recombination protein RmuC [Dehalococcoidales bacterium]|nr:DNA recombination protein RmuC [Dehalococcoidales bacterium]
MIEALLIAGIVLLIVLTVVLIFLVLRSKGVQPQDIETALSGTWTKLGLDRAIGAVETHAKDIRDSYRSFEQMLRVPTDRASFGELSLETILSDQLPPDMCHIRERILDGKTPDAHIRSTVGIICIDSKFPLDNYRNMLKAENPAERERFRRKFLKQDVQNHLNKISDDYVCPEKGSAEFAFAYIPSEAVYYFLVSDDEAFEMLRDYTKRGVQVVSPLTLSHKVELIKAGVHAKKLSEDAEKVRKQLISISQRFGDIDEKWRVFYHTHLRNMGSKAEELDEAYKKLRDEFDRISKLSEE